MREAPAWRPVRASDAPDTLSVRRTSVSSCLALGIPLLLGLAACTPAAAVGVQATSSPPAAPGQTGALTAGSSGTAPTATTSTEGAPAGLHVVHSPGVVTDDAHLTAGQCHTRTAAGGQPLPDPACTPGAIDPAVTQANIASTICRSGYTKTIRPPASDTGRWKIRTYVFYDLSTATTGEYDHLVPLELGGANATSNLWIEPGAIPNPKDKVETRLRDQVCAGQLTLAAAQREIVADWTTAN